MLHSITKYTLIVHPGDAISAGSCVRDSSCCVAPMPDASCMGLYKLLMVLMVV
jgi:hypothetical protein